MCVPKPASQFETGRLHPHFGKLASVIVAAALLTTANSPAAQLIRDGGDTCNGATIDAASGDWNTDTTTNLNSNNGSGNVSWTQTSTNGSTLPAAGVTTTLRGSGRIAGP